MKKQDKIFKSLELIGRFTIWAVIFNYLKYAEHLKIDTLIVVSLILIVWVFIPILNKEREN